MAVGINVFASKEDFVRLVSADIDHQMDTMKYAKCMQIVFPKKDHFFPSEYEEADEEILAKAVESLVLISSHVLMPEVETKLKRKLKI